MHARLLPDVLAADVLAAAELGTAALDGLLVPHGPAFLPIDVPEAPATRAAALRRHLGRGVIAAGRSAAWVWGALWRLEHPIIGCIALGRAPRVRPSPGIVVRELRLPERDVQHLADTPVTSPLRTAIDLACAAEPDFDQQALGRMLAIARLTPDQLGAELERRPRLPGRRRALVRLQVLFTR